MSDTAIMLAEPGTYGIRPTGYRLPEATHIGRVRLQVTSLDASLGFYRDVLGFRVLARDGAVARLGPHDEDVTLVELHEKPGIRASTEGSRWGLYHFAVLLPDRAALGRLLTRLAEWGGHVGMSDHFVSEAIYLRDPDGLGIEVYADRPRDAWRRNGAELSMTTIPLNVQDVMAAGGAERWAGMPTGTRIGHVHLHVGDIAGAEAFYHAALGFDKVVWSYGGALFLSAGGYHHHLGTNIWARRATSGAPEDEARLIDWELVLPDDTDVREVGETLERAGYKTVADGTSRIVNDPWGTTLRLVAANKG